eukprot:CAMPEP_0114996722 /NCGR_PEP_ID=MMETSP0216-20121206/14484_1 /TAXON_ID=223996 /ORGANISM="Protocruzia adherens, Strain Boccale" /LENGTH=717 /DNA_ID=CAMNT_0002360989 /DNA_START=63 /DNA_END=2216 /DNA_ORIENTATION=+
MDKFSPHTIDIHLNPINSVVVSPDGEYVLSCSENTIKKNDIYTKDVVIMTTEDSTHQYAITSMAITPDGVGLITGSDDRCVKIWKIGPTSLELKKTLLPHSGPVSDVFASTHCFLSAGADKTVNVISRKSLEVIKTVTLETWVNTVVMRPRTDVIIAGTEAGKLEVFDLTGENVRSVNAHSQGVKVLINHKCTSGSSVTISGSEDTNICVWKPDNWKLITTLKGHFFTVTALTSLTKRTIASASVDQTIRIWDLHSSETVCILEGHTLTILTIAADSEGRIYSGGEDNELRMWGPKCNDEIEFDIFNQRQVGDYFHQVDEKLDLTMRTMELNTLGELNNLKRDVAKHCLSQEELREDYEFTIIMENDFIRKHDALVSYLNFVQRHFLRIYNLALMVSTGEINLKNRVDSLLSVIEKYQSPPRKFGTTGNTRKVEKRMFLNLLEMSSSSSLITEAIHEIARKLTIRRREKLLKDESSHYFCHLFDNGPQDDYWHQIFKNDMKSKAEELAFLDTNILLALAGSGDVKCILDKANAGDEEDERSLFIDILLQNSLNTMARFDISLISDPISIDELIASFVKDLSSYQNGRLDTENCSTSTKDESTTNELVYESAAALRMDTEKNSPGGGSAGTVFNGYEEGYFRRPHDRLYTDSRIILGGSSCGIPKNLSMISSRTNTEYHDTREAEHHTGLDSDLREQLTSLVGKFNRSNEEEKQCSIF